MDYETHMQNDFSVFIWVVCIAVYYHLSFCQSYWSIIKLFSNVKSFALICLFFIDTTDTGILLFSYEKKKHLLAIIL